MNATVMCEKCGKPLGVFDGNVCNECENNAVLDKIRDEIADLDYLNIEDGSDGYDKYIEQYEVLKIIDKYRGDKE